MVDSHGEIIKYKLNSPFVYFRSLVKDLSTPEAGMAVRNMSDQGYKFQNNRQQLMLCGFLFMLRLDSREKMNTLARYGDP